MNIYKITFVNPEEDGYAAAKKMVAKHNTNTTEKILLTPDDKSLLYPAKSLTELNHFVSYGGGIKHIELVGTISDTFFQPLIAEAEFVANQIRSQKNGTPLGYQG